MKRFGFGLIFGTVLTAIAIWLTVTYTGAYNIAASAQHTDAVRWTLDTTMRRSVERRAGDVVLPESFPDELIAEGAARYAESCVYCHGAPGQDPAKWSRGMRPEPPHLAEAAAEWRPEEIRWIIENGIRMTGMPAFGDHHKPDEIVALTAFVARLPGLTSEDFRMMTGDAADTDGNGVPAGGGEARDGDGIAPAPKAD
ncbi:cytochrome c [Aurantimonas manganoxydans SI85-9A1]|uniref:Cytochrome c n=1 Tax=Aurantimonas manganoxydans (strain ATCC BAA-1229 / DSM 21871 / SI85-9A1) TaxID=287752 RepID=Q1YMX4_AURMS|nr:cytochrome c [Aurantimonas manganoxydans]EAS51257.1 cytochrome c [Aurantimonas manganoxydans SI85-9A1]